MSPLSRMLLSMIFKHHYCATGLSRIDLQYRPHDYFWAMDCGIRLASDITGVVRRQLYEQALLDGDHTAAAALLAESELSREDRLAISRLHPSWMGGEYLPRKRAGEVEIARIGIASLGLDVTCVFARRGRSRIHYRTVDEYGGTTLERSTRSSIRPLTLQQLGHFFLDCWNLAAVLDANFADMDDPRDSAHAFVTHASSSFYAEFGDYVTQRVNAWLERRK